MIVTRMGMLSLIDRSNKSCILLDFSDKGKRENFRPNYVAFVRHTF